VDATKTYHWKFEKPGYKTIESDLKVAVGSNDRRDVRMPTTEGALAAGEMQVDPAVEAFNAGAEAYAQGDTGTALRNFEAAVAANPALAAPHAAIGRIHAEAKSYAEAAAAAERALALEPANVAALRVAVVAYRELGDSAKLAAAQQALAGADPRSMAGTHYEDAVKLFNEGKTAEAAAALEQAVEADPDHAKSHYILGLCYSGLGDSAKAKLHFETFLRLAPDDPDAGTAQEMLKYL
jgi:tetratricopeptide (TPR) repeat protein